MNKTVFFLILFITIPFLSYNQAVTSEIECESSWSFSIYGTCIGKNNSLLHFDIDKDGIDEIISSSVAYEFRNQGYWYILKYNSAKQSYLPIYSSKLYPYEIEEMKIFDLKGDNSFELVFFTSSQLHIVSLETFKTIRKVNVEGVYASGNSLLYADVDNDGSKNLVFTSYYKTYILNDDASISLDTIEIGGASIDAGNVDNDPAIEVVFSSGEIIEMQGKTIRTRARIETNTNGNILVKLVNLDSDSKLEMLTIQELIRVYDVDSHSLKNQLDIGDINLSSVQFRDMNNDNYPDIIFGSFPLFKLKINCFDLIHKNYIWQHGTQYQEMASMAIANVDDDSKNEIVFSVGCSTTVTDNLVVLDFETKNLEWISTSPSGPFKVVKVNDVNQDGRLELITYSSSTQSISPLSSNCPILYVFDYETRELKFSSSETLFQAGDYTDIADFEIMNVDEDADKEIVFIAELKNSTSLIILNGNNFSLEKQVNFPYLQGQSLHNLEVNDVDNDGKLEYIVATPGKIYIIDGTNYTSKWDYPISGSSYILPVVRLGNIDGDSNNEIIVTARTKIMVIDGITKEIWTIKNDINYIDFITATIADYNNDGINDIIAGYERGEIKVFDGSSKSMITKLTVSKEDIDNIVVHDLNNDGIDELIVSSDSRIIFSTKQGKLIQTQWLAKNVGKVNGIFVGDKIIVGTDVGLIEISECYTCLFNGAEINVVNPTCGNDNGKIIVTAGAEHTIKWADGNFGSSRANLKAGQYYVTISDATGCVVPSTIELKNEILDVYLIAPPILCTSNADRGTIYASISYGKAPLVYKWSTGDTADTLKNMPVGKYYLTVTDANNCVSIDSASLDFQKLDLRQRLTHPCKDLANGKITFDYYSGVYPYTFTWSDGNTASQRTSLPKGIYKVTIVDGAQCVSKKEIDLYEAKINFKVNHGNICQTGTTSAQVQFDQTDYYQVKWSNGFTGSQSFNLSEGNHTVTVTNSNNCSTVDTFTILKSMLALKLDTLQITCNGTTNGGLTVIPKNGIQPYVYSWNNGKTTPQIDNLGAGSYSVFVTDSIYCSKIISARLDQPTKIMASFDVINDNPNTTIFDGSLTVNPSGGTPPYTYYWSNFQTTKTITGLKQGTYVVTITDKNNCEEAVSANISIGTPNIDISDGIVLKVFPNPVQDFLKIQNASTKPSRDMHFRIVDVLGRAITPTQILSLQIGESVVFDVRAIPVGYYLLLIETQGKTYRANLLINR